MRLERSAQKLFDRADIVRDVWLRDLPGVSLTDVGLCEIIRSRQPEVQYEIPNCNLGGCGLSRCGWVGCLFLGGQQRPPDRADCVRSCAVNLPRFDCRFALSR